MKVIDNNFPDTYKLIVPQTKNISASLDISFNVNTQKNFTFYKYYIHFNMDSSIKKCKTQMFAFNTKML